MLTFSERVVKLALSIPKGKVTTYGRITRAAGGGARAAMSITSILGKAYREGETRIPFHRIVFSSGKIWIDDERITERMKMYTAEGIKIDRTGRIVDFEKHLVEFK